jgi:hypothetical protein
MELTVVGFGVRPRLPMHGFAIRSPPPMHGFAIRSRLPMRGFAIRSPRQAPALHNRSGLRPSLKTRQAGRS